MSTAAAYLASETTKTCGALLDELDEIADDIRQADTARLADLEEKTLTALHESLWRLHANLQHARRITILLKAVTSDSGEDAS